LPSEGVRGQDPAAAAVSRLWQRDKRRCICLDVQESATCDPTHDLAPVLARRLPVFRGLAGQRGTA